MKQLKVYVSHCIRGKKGSKATREYIQRNVTLAILFGQALRREFPNIDFYVPGDHEYPPVGNLLEKGYVTIDQVLAVDCDILKNCNFVVAFSPNGYLSKGMKKEIEYAEENGIPVIIVSKLYKSGIASINRQIQESMR